MFIDLASTTRPVVRGGGPEVMPSREPRLRLNDYYEVYAPARPDAAQAQGERCMNCGAAFCMPDSGYGAPGKVGCPIYNKIPEWNELVRLGRWEDAYHRLSLTNPFPEFTARVCPAPCQDACILGINEAPVQIKGIERAIIDRAFESGWVKPPQLQPPTGKRVAIVGSGPAGLAAADRLIRGGFSVTVYERSDRPGGLLRYGVPNMKLDKAILDRRIGLLVDSGVQFKLGCSVGREVSAAQLRAGCDAIILACGALKPRDVEVPGRELRGIHQAIAYLTASMKTLQSDTHPAIDARGKHVVIIGAGDTGADCLATALRQGAASVVNLARGDMPPSERDAAHAWPGPTGTLAYDYAHREAAALQGTDPRWWQATTRAFLADAEDPAAVAAVELKDAAGDIHRIPAELVILSVGFTGHDSSHLLEALNPSSSIASDASASQAPAGSTIPIHLAGDMAIGPSLVVHAIAEGLRAAQTIAQQLGSPLR